MTQTGTAIPLFAAPVPGAGERARLAQEASGLGVWDWEVERDELHWDEVARALHGVAPGAPVSGEVLRSCIHPDDRPAEEAAVRASLDPAVRGPCETSYRVRVAESERWIHAVGQVVWAGEGLSARAVRVFPGVFIGTRNAVMPCPRSPGRVHANTIATVASSALATHTLRPRIR